MPRFLGVKFVASGFPDAARLALAAVRALHRSAARAAEGGTPPPPTTDLSLLKIDLRVGGR